MKIHYFQHVPFEGLGCIRDWIDSNEHKCTATRFYADDTLPQQLEQIDWLIVMGGPMSTYEMNRYPWMKREMRFIENAIAQGKVVVGICLGAQLIAQTLGAQVYPNADKEIGWFPIKLTEAGKQSALFGEFPEEFSVFHWHGDSFDLPSQAVRIAENEGCLNQAFVYGENVVGLQFHLDFTKRSVEQLLHHCKTDISVGPYIQSEDAMLSKETRFKEANNKMFGILDRLEGFL